MHTVEDKKAAFERLLTIMDDLRSQCPWDKKQTMHTLRHLTIEEVYELTDAIMENDIQEVKKELGDIILHMVFYAKIASEIENAIKSILIKYSEQQAEIVNLKKQIEEIGQQPASKGIKQSEVKVDLSSMTKKERILFNLKNN